MLAGVVGDVGGNGGQADNFDPASIPSPQFPITAVQCQLIQFYADPDGTEHLGPDLAESFEAVDPLTYVFHLRKGVTFSPDLGFPLSSFSGVNGREVTADDVVWTFTYMKKGVGKAFFHPWVTVKAVDKYTVKFTLAEPDADFLSLVASGRSGPAVIAREIFEKKGTLKDGPMISPGPWVLKSANWATGLWEYVKNPNYYIVGVDGKPLPYLDAITVKQVLDPATSLAALRSGESKFRFLDKTAYDVLRREHPEWTYPGIPYLRGGAAGLWMNRNAAPFNNEDFRRALFYAWDPYEVISNAGGPSWGHFHGGYPLPGVDWYKEFEEHTRPYVGNLEKAKAFLAKSGVQTPVRLRMETRNDISPGEVQLVQDQLARIGVETDIVPRDPATVAATVYSNKWPDGQLFYVRYGSLPLSNWININFHSTGTYAKAQGISDPKLDAIVEAQQQELDADKRRRLVRDMLVYTLEHGLNAAGWAASMQIVRRPEFHVTLGPVGGQFSWRYLADAWLDN